ncbi:MAG TPA: PAC2 family protein [Acidimicrobiales bacterium]|jgi:proteasome assembly chaperone (PAC2) family protein|nr:PAC2 family protein [Acidimicrobiales bacterium]
MDLVTWERRPVLRHPLLVTAFEGWNDAGDAASLAVAYLADVWGAESFATIDPEEFFDFTSARPHVRIVDDDSRTIEWPSTTLSAATIPGTERDVIFVRGVEPQLRWRTFCAAIVDVATALGAEMAVSLGALLADVPHTRPVKVTGTTDDPDLTGRLGLIHSTYEGPTGIIGVLASACSDAGLPSASFWAAVPHYVHQVPSPKAALALVERSAAVLGARVNPLELRFAADEYERQVSERVADDEDAAAYVAQLEAADDSDTGEASEGIFRNPGGSAAGGGTAGGAGVHLDPGGLADEVERFLREHRREK